MITLLIFALPFLAALLMVLLGARANMRRIAVGALLLQTCAAGWLTLNLVGEFAVTRGAALAFFPLERYLAPSPDGGTWLAFIGADAVSLPFLFLVLGGFAIVLWDRISVARLPGILYPLLMVLNGCLIGAITAVNVVLLALFVLSVICLVLLMLRLWGGSGAHLAGRRFFPVGFLGVLLLGTVLFGYATTPERDLAPHVEREQRFELPQLAEQEFRFRTENFGTDTMAADSTGDVVLLAMLVLPALFLMFFPFHAMFGSALDAAPQSLAPLFWVLGPSLGFPLMIRGALWLFPEFWIEGWGRYIFPAVGGLTALYGGFVALGEFDHARILRFLLTGWCGLGILLLSAQRDTWVSVGLVSVFLSTLMLALNRMGSRGDEGRRADEDSAGYEVVGVPGGRFSGQVLVYAPLLLLTFLVLDVFLYDTGYQGRAFPVLWYLLGVASASVILAAAAMRLGRLFPARFKVSDAVIADSVISMPENIRAWLLGVLLIGCAGAGIWLLVSLTGPLVEQVLQRESGGHGVIGAAVQLWEGDHG